MGKFAKTLICAILASACWIINPTGWGAESNVTGDTKLEVNISGILETTKKPGDLMKVDNISIDHLYKQIPLFVKPSITPQQKKISDATNAAKEAKKAAREARKAAKAAKKSGNTAVKAAAEAAQAAAAAAEDAAKAAQAVTPNTVVTNPREIELDSDPKTSLIKALIDLVEIAEIIAPNPDQVWYYKKEKSDRRMDYIELVIITGKTEATKTKTSYLIEKRKKLYCDRVTPAGPEELEVPFEALKSLKIEGYTRREDEKRKQKDVDERKVIEKLIEQEKKAKAKA